MSRRPAIKILPPLLLGICLDSSLLNGLPWTILLGSNVLLLVLASILIRRFRPLIVDSILLLILILSGALAACGAKTGGGCLDMDSKAATTVLIEVRGFSEPVGSERVRFEGCLRYVALAETFRTIDQMAMVDLGVTSVQPVPGMIIVANGNLSRPDRRKNPGGVSQTDIFDQKGLNWSFRSGKGDWKVLPGEGRGALDPSIGERARAEIGGRLESTFTEEQAGFLKGILLGERGQIPSERKIQFSRAGVFHILAISGLHVGIITGICLLLFSILRIPSFPRIVILLAVLLIYGILAGMKPSIQRAIVMAVSIMAATSAARKIDVVNLLYWLAACFIFLSPRTLWNTGFQMSFLATWGILALYPALNRCLDSLRYRPLSHLHFLLQIALVSLCAQAPLVPVMASSYHSVSPISPVSNMVVLPIASVLLPAGLISLLTQSVGTFLSGPFSEVTALLIELLFRVVEFFSRYSLASITVPSFGNVGSASYYSALFMLSLCLERRMKWETAAIAMLLVGTTHAGLSLASHERPLRVTYLDVGQGDSAVIEFPTGEIMIMDGGPGGRQWDAGRAVIEPYLLERRFDRVDLLAFSHPQLDHIGGFPHVMDRYAVRALLEPGQPNDLESYIMILEKSLEGGVTVCWPRRGDSLSIGGAELLVLHPSSEWIDDYPDQDSVNDASLVIKLIFKGVSFLMTGDIGAGVEEDLQNHFGVNLASDVLKVSHHGSHHSTTVPFLKSVDPRVAVISVGRNNTFGHPSPVVLGTIREMGADVFRTDIHGAIVVCVEDGRFEVTDGSDRLLGRYVSPRQPGKPRTEESEVGEHEP